MAKVTEKEYTFKEILAKYCLYEDSSKEICQKIFDGQSVSDVAKYYSLTFQDVKDLFATKVRAAFTDLADGPSADGMLTIKEVKDYILRK